MGHSPRCAAWAGGYRTTWRYPGLTTCRGRGTPARGLSTVRQAAAATNAYQAATALGLPFGTVIYFSVDYDATDDDMASAIIPHFQGIQASMNSIGGPQYAVGVYGTRNTCSTLYAQGLATRSFASDMSTGYSGNLGFPLPDNWAFDQIATITLDDGESDSVEIDNDLVSGWDPGIKSVTTPSDPNANFYTYLTWLEARGAEWIEQGNNGSSASELSLPNTCARWTAPIWAPRPIWFSALSTRASSTTPTPSPVCRLIRRSVIPTCSGRRYLSLRRVLRRSRQSWPCQRPYVGQRG